MTCTLFNRSQRAAEHAGVLEAACAASQIPLSHGSMSWGLSPSRASEVCIDSPSSPSPCARGVLYILQVSQDLFRRPIQLIPAFRGDPMTRMLALVVGEFSPTKPALDFLFRRRCGSKRGPPQGRSGGRRHAVLASANKSVFTRARSAGVRGGHDLEDSRDKASRRATPSADKCWP